jgi:hypothetical protein
MLRRTFIALTSAATIASASVVFAGGIQKTSWTQLLVQAPSPH